MDRPWVEVYIGLMNFYGCLERLYGLLHKGFTGFAMVFQALISKGSFGLIGFNKFGVVQSFPVSGLVLLI